MSPTRDSKDALSTTPDYPVKEKRECVVTYRVEEPVLESNEEEDPEDEEDFSSEDEDEDGKECPAEMRSTKKSTRNFHGPHMDVIYTKQLIYHEKNDMRKSSRHRHKSDESKNNMFLFDDLFGEMRRGKSMPLFKDTGVIESSFVADAIEAPQSLSQKPSFGCGAEGDDFTGLEDESPALNSDV